MPGDNAYYEAQDLLSPTLHSASYTTQHHTITPKPFTTGVNQHSTMSTDVIKWWTFNQISRLGTGWFLPRIDLIHKSFIWKLFIWCLVITVLLSQSPDGNCFGGDITMFWKVYNLSGSQIKMVGENLHPAFPDLKELPTGHTKTLFPTDIRVWGRFNSLVVPDNGYISRHTCFPGRLIHNHR